MSKKYYVLSHALARNRALECVRDAPEGYVVTVNEPTRNLEQNALIHALLNSLGDELGWVFSGQPVDLDDLKSIFMAAYRKATNQHVRFVIGIDGQPVVLNWRTRNLSKRECAEFIEFVQAWLTTSPHLKAGDSLNRSLLSETGNELRKNIASRI
jgi:hypothetical protein